MPNEDKEKSNEIEVWVHLVALLTSLSVFDMYSNIASILGSLEVR